MLALQNHPDPALVVLDNVDVGTWSQQFPGGLVSVLATARAQRLNIRRSTAALLMGRNILARDVTTFVLLAPSVRGRVRTVVDVRTAFAFGLGIVLGRWLLRRLRLA